MDESNLFKKYCWTLSIVDIDLVLSEIYRYREIDEKKMEMGCYLAIPSFTWEAIYNN